MKPGNLLEMRAVKQLLAVALPVVLSAPAFTPAALALNPQTDLTLSDGAGYSSVAAPLSSSLTTELNLDERPAAYDSRTNGYDSYRRALKAVVEREPTFGEALGQAFDQTLTELAPKLEQQFGIDRLRSAVDLPGKIGGIYERSHEKALAAGEYCFGAYEGSTAGRIASATLCATAEMMEESSREFRISAVNMSLPEADIAPETLAAREQWYERVFDVVVNANVTPEEVVDAGTALKASVIPGLVTAGNQNIKLSQGPAMFGQTLTPQNMLLDAATGYVDEYSYSHGGSASPVVYQVGKIAVPIVATGVGTGVAGGLSRLAQTTRGLKTVGMTTGELEVAATVGSRSSASASLGTRLSSYLDDVSTRFSNWMDDLGNGSGGLSLADGPPAIPKSPPPSTKPTGPSLSEIYGSNLPQPLPTQDIMASTGKPPPLPTNLKGRTVQPSPPSTAPGAASSNTGSVPTQPTGAPPPAHDPWTSMAGSVPTPPSTPPAPLPPAPQGPPAGMLGTLERLPSDGVTPNYTGTVKSVNRGSRGPLPPSHYSLEDIRPVLVRRLGRPLTEVELLNARMHYTNQFFNPNIVSPTPNSIFDALFPDGVPTPSVPPISTPTAVAPPQPPPGMHTVTPASAATATPPPPQSWWQRWWPW